MAMRRKGCLFRKLFLVIFDCLFCKLLREEHFYCNEDLTKFSNVCIDEDTYKKYSEGIMKRYPGFVIKEGSSYLEALDKEGTASFEDMRKLLMLDKGEVESSSYL